MESGLNEFLIDDDRNNINEIAKIYGYDLSKCCSCCFWIKIKSVDKQYWNVVDEQNEKIKQRKDDTIYF